MKPIKILFITFLSLVNTLSFASLPFQSLEQLKGNTQSMIERVASKNKVNRFSMKADGNILPAGRAFAYTWGVFYHENGHTWYYTQTFENRGWYLGSSEITIYDNNFSRMGAFTIEIPEDMNVNDINPIDFLSTTFFDTDASTLEIPVFIHAVDNGTQINRIGIYHLDGEKIQEYNSQSMLDFRASDSYMRVLLMNESDGNINVSVLRSAQADALPVIEHTFSVDQDLMYYNNGPVINYYSINNEPYYVVSHFEKPCMDGYDMENFIPTQTPDNYLTIKTYDRNFEMVDSIGVSIDATNEEATYGFASLGMLTMNDVRIGDFTNDNQFNYIVTHYDYFALSDEFVYYFKVYDSDGNLVNTIVENTTTWFPLSDLEGFEEQVSFLKLGTDGTQILEMVDIPSCEVAATFPAVIDGYNISATFDRCRVDDDYQYVISIANAEEDKDGNAMARIGWYRRDCTVDHYVTFNLGKNAEGFTPYIANYVLNPYLFNTDSKREYFYLAMNKRTDGSEVLDKTLYLADEDGKVLLTIKPEAGDEIEFSSGDIFDPNTPAPSLVLSFYNGEKDAFEVMLYKLPFFTFTSGGDGTQENPYIITTPGELAQMHTQPAAHYVLGNDIDMSGYESTYFAPDTFTGSFDGNNYFIKNAVLVNNGLFGNTQDATIKNVQIKSPVLFTVDGNNGIIAASSINTTIENVHVYDAMIDGEVGFDMNVGGLVGIAENTNFSAVSVIRTVVNNCINNMGGIVGYMKGSNINAAVTNGEVILGGFSIGGIAAVADANSNITNCHTAWNATALSSIGGIVCNSQRANISYCYADGFYADCVDDVTWPTYGGIVYMLDEAQDGSTSYVISNCVTTNYDVVRECADNEQGLYNNYTGSTDNQYNTKHPSAYKPVEEMNSSFFESLGYRYGNNNDAPWMGESLPILYFENECQSVIGIDCDNSSVNYDGYSIWCNDANYIYMYDLQGNCVASINASALNVSTMNAGVYIVVAIDANGESNVRKIVIK